MATEIEGVRAVETAVAQHEFHIRVGHTLVPHGGGFVVDVKIAIGRVTPAARAQEIYRSAEIAARMIVAARFAATEGYRVPTVAQHVAVHDDRAIASAGNRERVCERGVRRVFYGQIFQNKIVRVIN